MDLMKELGYDRLGAQGGDWGADVTTLLGLRHAERVIGIHLNTIPPYKPYLEPGTALTEVEQAFLNEASRWYEKSGAYDHIQKTTPQTVAYGLTDSPAGLAAWILEKFRDWADCDGDIERSFTKDELLSNITLYWMTQTIYSSCRLYYEDSRSTPLHFQKGDYVTVPCGIAHFPKEAPLAPKRWVERGYNVQHWTEMSRGGHFAALEEPELLVEDIRLFFRTLRSD
jgi:pimeloyl-ACP methyl ester carboxylesterase